MGEVVCEERMGIGERRNGLWGEIEVCGRNGV